jgi:hypothetical protein
MVVIILTDYLLSLEETSKNIAIYLNANHKLSIKKEDVLALFKDILIVEDHVLKVVSAAKNKTYINLNSFFTTFYGEAIDSIIRKSNDFKLEEHIKNTICMKKLAQELEISLETIGELRSAYIKLKREINE